MGAEPVMYPYRNECCGAYVALEDKVRRVQISVQIARSIRRIAAGAEELVTACPAVHVQPGGKRDRQ